MTKEQFDSFLRMKTLITKLKQIPISPGLLDPNTIDRLLSSLDTFETSLNKIKYFPKFNTNYNPEFIHDTRSEEQLMADLCIVYAIFGRSIMKRFNYHNYTIHFKKLIERSKCPVRGTYERLCKVEVDIYEDESIYKESVILEFQPLCSTDVWLHDIGVSVKNFSRYKNFSIYFISMELMAIWNFYFYTTIPGLVENITTPEELCKPERNILILPIIYNYFLISMLV